MIRTIIVDDHTLFAEGIERLLHETQRFTIVRKFNSGIAFLQALPLESIDLVILDVDMPHLNGFEVIQRLRLQNKSVKIVVVSMHDTIAYSNEAADLGANAYLVKSLDSDTLLTRLAELMDGKNFFSRKIKQVKMISLLSKRENEVVKLMATGKTSEEISTLLKISTVTVKTHRINIFRKLDARNAAELITKAFHHGLL